VKRVGGGERTFESQMEYHLADGRSPHFDVGQPDRIKLARVLLNRSITRLETPGQALKIVELGCGAGDVTGPWAGTHDVIGIDVVPQSQIECNTRWPDMTFMLRPVEEVCPIECDILVMTEFLEHVSDPVTITREWMRLAKEAIIGHPLDEPDPPFEGGHFWSYDLEDFDAWFTANGYTIVEKFIFPMGPWPRMVIGNGGRLPPAA